MNALQAMTKHLNVTFTENGDLAYKSTGSACLDFFSLCGGMRNNPSDLSALFTKAYGENPVVAIKILFYLRNVRGGLGERNSFRELLKMLAQLYPAVAKQIIYAVPEYGRWDDLLVLLETPIKDEVLVLIKSQLEKDKEALEEGREVSLLGKWLPSINTSSKESVARGKLIMQGLGMKAVEYRKLCSALRRKIKILEEYLRCKDYSFDYTQQPSQAMLRYRKAFMRNDQERYQAFLDKVVEQSKMIAQGEIVPDEDRVKLNAGTLYPYQIVAPFTDSFQKGNGIPKEIALPLEASWQVLDRGVFDSKTIVVRDGSGSMYGGGTASAINIANSLALLFAEQLGGAYKNSFITFSRFPQLIQIPATADTLQKKLHFISQFDEVANTDISKVYELLLNVAKDSAVPKEEMIDRLLIVSDMEFDYCTEGISTFAYWKSEFEGAGYKFPEIVFWNVAARSIHLPVTQNELGVKLVSGASASIFGNVISGDLKVITPYDFMLQLLEPYGEFDAIVA